MVITIILNDYGDDGDNDADEEDVYNVTVSCSLSTPRYRKHPEYRNESKTGCLDDGKDNF